MGNGLLRGGGASRFCLCFLEAARLCVLVLFDFLKGFLILIFLFPFAFLNSEIPVRRLALRFQALYKLTPHTMTALVSRRGTAEPQRERGTFRKGRERMA